MLNGDLKTRGGEKLLHTFKGYRKAAKNLSIFRPNLMACIINIIIYFYYRFVIIIRCYYDINLYERSRLNFTFDIDTT